MARVRVNGIMLCRSTGTAIRAEAEESLARLVVLADCRSRSIVERAPLVRAWPLYEASAAVARLAPATRQAKYRAWLHFSVWLYGSHPEVREAHEVTHHMAEEYLTFFQNGRAPVTCNLRISVLREMFRTVLVARGADAVNPWDRVRRRAGGGYTRRELTLDEVRRLLAVSGECGHEWRMLFSLAIYTGMRLGDCCRLKWEAVNLSSSVIQIIPHKTRRHMAGRQVTIPLHVELSEMLKDVPSKSRSGFVLDGLAHDFVERRWIVSRRLDWIFKRAQIKTSVMLEGRERRTPSATFHSLRHTFVSIAVNAGVPLATVQSIVGHTSTAMTRHYYHPSEVALRQAVNAIPAIGSAVGDMFRSCARVSHISPSAPAFCSRLRELEKARKKGFITTDEFLALRQKILAEA